MLCDGSEHGEEGGVGGGGGRGSSLSEERLDIEVVIWMKRPVES